jgi:hypothetical protein
MQATSHQGSPSLLSALHIFLSKINAMKKSPECSYCIKTKQICRYRDKFDVAWRGQTTVAQKRAERRKRTKEEENEKHTVNSPKSQNDLLDQVSEISSHPPS